MVEDHHRGKIYIDGSHTPGARFVIELPKAAQKTQDS
jgi:signal transduction histidine kinase